MISDSHPNVPRIAGLYVKEPYRRQGIGETLLTQFMKGVTGDAYAVHASEESFTFHVKQPYETVFLGEMKRGENPATPPLLDVDTSLTTHGIPTFETPETASDYIANCEGDAKPAVYIHITRPPLPTDHECDASGETQRFMTRDAITADICEVHIIQEHVTPVTHEIRDLLDILPRQIYPEYPRADHTAWLPTSTDECDRNITSWPIPLSTARKLADEVHTVLCDSPVNCDVLVTHQLPTSV